MGETECAQCEPGSFSIGGGVRISSWEPTWDTTSEVNDLKEDHS